MPIANGEILSLSIRNKAKMSTLTSCSQYCAQYHTQCTKARKINKCHYTYNELTKIISFHRVHYCQCKKSQSTYKGRKIQKQKHKTQREYT